MKKETAEILLETFEEIEELYPNKSFEWQTQFAADTANMRGHHDFQACDVVVALAEHSRFRT